MTLIRVGVFGALGRMGQSVCAAVAADPELELVARVDPSPGGDAPDALVSGGAQVIVDFTHPEQVMENIRLSLEHGIHCVIGTSGFSADKIEEVRGLLDGRANVFIAPNFGIGAVLMMQFARIAAPFMASCEIVELHHNQKADAPSGTAHATASIVAEAWRAHGRPVGGEPRADEFETVEGARGASVDGVHVHSVRMRGLLAHQEIVFGGPGELLTIRHDSLDRESYMPGVVLAVKSVRSHPGLTVGLEHFLGLA